MDQSPVSNSENCGNVPYTAKTHSNDQNSEAFKIGVPTKNANRKTPGSNHFTGSYSVPKFGEWDESDPRSGEEYTLIFDKIREERRIEAAKFASVPSEATKRKDASKKETFKRKVRDLFTYVRRS